MIRKIDHMVITTTDINRCIVFYQKLGFKVKNTADRYELFTGDFKINVHIKGNEFIPHAENIQTGSADFCLEICSDIEQFKKFLESQGLSILEGIVLRNGTNGKMDSIYLYDPDGNLIEFCCYE